ncbi:MAG TPA: GMC family oxidoreductase [Ilumatobacter sp.]|nr:GMC family oxidoreductase [Ilumatobacter sp.]
MHWIVVGGGSAGCAVASRLVAHPDDDVVLLEAGPANQPAHATDTGPRPDDATFNRPGVMVSRRAGDAVAPYSQGRGLGGSSLINGGVVTTKIPTHLEAIVPRERPWARGPVGDALLTSDDGAREVELVRRNGKRVTAADMFLGSLAAAPNLEIRTSTTVQRLVIDGRRVVGVETAGGDEVTGDAVVLCGGAIETPGLLLRSGVDTPGVGVGVQDHPSVRLAFDLDPDRFDPTVSAISATVERGTHQILALDHVRADLPLGVLMTGLLRVASRGAVTLPDPDGSPVVQFNMLTDSEDATGLVGAALDLVDIARRRTFRDAVGRMYIDDHGTELSTLTSADDVARWALAAELGGYHHVSASCRRGVVTDADGWVRGYDRLAIGDASLFDGVPASDPYIAVVAQALRLPTQAFLTRFR